MQILESRCSGSINANFGATITASQSLLKKNNYVGHACYFST